MINIKKYIPKNFELPQLNGISPKNIEEHLKLYAGYVNNTNLILEKIDEYENDKEKNAYAINELRRRFGFEFGGMRNHEYYFGALVDGPQKINTDSPLAQKIIGENGSFEMWLESFKSIAVTRGVGWAMLYYDKQNGNLINHWIDEQHIGHPVGLSPILCLDMWEHAFVYDYATSEKKKYIDAYFENINWSVIEENFNQASK
ncbi:MAG: Fe-Mn family superoxide dismutase [Candidatus Pacebacteria bacterium]|nr:Fe-Mn family superoxide dismutase [Candidatus Paceibacterota bacterium]